MAATQARSGVPGRDARPRTNRAPATAVIGSAVLLALATALALVSLGDALAPARPMAVAYPADGTTLRRFVAAANAVLAGADPAALDAAIAPSAPVHLPDLPVGNRAALAGRLAAFGRGTPGLRLELADVMSGDGWAAARLTMRGGSRATAGAPFEGSVVLRTEGGRAAEVWYDLQPNAAARRLPAVRTPAWSGPTPVTLVRFTLPPGTTLPGLAASGVQVLLAEAGEVEVEPDGPAMLFAERRGVGWQELPGATDPLRLRPGDALLGEGGVGVVLRNPGAAPASVLGFATWPGGAFDAGDRARSQPWQQNASLAYQRSAGSRLAWPGGVTSTMLARGAGAARQAGCDTPAPVALSVMLVTLAPGEAIPAHPVRGVELAATDQEPASPHQAERWDRSDGDGGASLRASDASLLEIDFGTAVSDRPAHELRNDSARPLDVVVFALVPGGDRLPAASVSGRERAAAIDAGPPARPPATATVPPEYRRFFPAATPAGNEASGDGSCRGPAPGRLGTAR